MKNEEMEKNPFLYLINLSRNKIKINDTHKQIKEKYKGISPIKLLKFTIFQTQIWLMNSISLLNIII